MGFQKGEHFFFFKAKMIKILSTHIKKTRHGSEILRLEQTHSKVTV